MMYSSVEISISYFPFLFVLIMWDEWDSFEINAGLNYPNLFQPYWGTQIFGPSIWPIFFHDHLRPQLNAQQNNFIFCGFRGVAQDDGKKLVWDGPGLLIFVVACYLLMDEII